MEAIGETNPVPYATEMPVSDFGFFWKLCKLPYLRLNIVRRIMRFSNQFRFHLGKYELFTMYSNNKRYIVFYF